VVGSDGLFHAGPALKRQLAEEDAMPTISQSAALALCTKALAKRIGRRPHLALHDSFPDGGRLFGEGEPGSAASQTNCFIGKSGRIEHLHTPGG
jgi:hypothetical protein